MYGGVKGYALFDTYTTTNTQKLRNEGDLIRRLYFDTELAFKRKSNIIPTKSRKKRPTHFDNRA